MVRIPIVDDEPNLRHTVGFNLQREGYEVIQAADGEAGLADAESQPPDLVVLDLMLPGIGGLEVCLGLRQRSTVPILMLTARDTAIDRVVGLEVGADDYLPEPFSMRELLARVRAILRRAELDRVAQVPAPPERIVVEGLIVYPARRRVELNGALIVLEPREFDLLAFLASHPGQVFSRSELLNQVWGFEFAGDARTVDVHVRSLRTKLGDRANDSSWIETVWGVGYCLREPGAER